jgi:ketosteroid isomerase-like protein
MNSRLGRNSGPFLPPASDEVWDRKTRRTRELIRLVYEAIASGDAEGLKALVAEGVVWEQSPSVPAWECRGRDDFVREITRGVVRKVFEPGSFRLDVQRVVVDGEVAVVQQRVVAWTRQHTRYEMEYCWIYTFEHEQLIHIREYLDTWLASRLLHWTESGRWDSVGK